MPILPDYHSEPGIIIISHKHRDERRAVLRPHSGKLSYEYLKNGAWVCDYTTEAYRADRPYFLKFYEVNVPLLVAALSDAAQ